MKKINLSYVFAIITIFVSSSCVQLKEMATLSKCEFRLASVQNLSLAGVNVQNITKFSQLNLLDAAKITTAIASGNLPLTFTLNVDVKNPNSIKASMNSLDWILLIDDIEMLNGIVNKRFEIEPLGGVTTLPIALNIDLKKALSSSSGDALLNFGLNLTGVGNKPSRMTLKAKPSILVAGNTIKYPGYINIRNEFTSN